MSKLVICVDGITQGALRPFTPDISWSSYVDWLKKRRPDLDVIHCMQPNDWADIFAGTARDYDDLVTDMVKNLIHSPVNPPRAVVVLGFSMGGLTALSLIHYLIKLGIPLDLDYLAFCTFGTPFGGANWLDHLYRRIPISYVQRIFDVDETIAHFKQLIGLESGMSMRILLHAIKHDEMVDPESALLPDQWLQFAELKPTLKWGKFILDPGTIVRAHDGLLHNPVAIGYIDGLVDGLLPVDGLPEYVVFEKKTLI